MPFDTKLDPENEERFTNWAGRLSEIRKRDMLKDLEDYDLRGYWLNGGSADTSSEGHFPDTYKKPNHPTFSDQSIYHDGENFIGGSWKGDTAFVPGPTNLKYRDPVSLWEYFKEHEPNVRLLGPGDK